MILSCCVRRALSSTVKLSGTIRHCRALSGCRAVGLSGLSGCHNVRKPRVVPRILDDGGPVKRAQPPPPPSLPPSQRSHCELLLQRFLGKRQQCNCHFRCAHTPPQSLPAPDAPQSETFRRSATGRLGHSSFPEHRTERSRRLLHLVYLSLFLHFYRAQELRRDCRFSVCL